MRRLVLEDDNGLDRLERGNELSSIGGRHDRPFRPLVRLNGPVGVDADDKGVALCLGGGQITDVSGVKEIKDAIREDDAPACLPNSICDLGSMRNGERRSLHLGT
jgi:hypothetical protein